MKRRPAGNSLKGLVLIMSGRATEGSSLVSGKKLVFWKELIRCVGIIITRRHHVGSGWYEIVL